VSKNGSAGLGGLITSSKYIEICINILSLCIHQQKTRNPKSECFFLLQTTWLHKSLEGLNSFLAHSDGELWPATVRGGIPPRLAFVGAKFWPFFGFWAIILDPDMLASQSRALKTRFRVKNPKKHWAKKISHWPGAQGQAKLA